MSAVLNLLILSLAAFLVANFFPGIRIKSFMTAVVVAIVYSIINFFSAGCSLCSLCPSSSLPLGLFKLVINAAMLWANDKVIEDFEIKDFSTTVLAALCITLVDSLLKWAFYPTP